MPERMTTEASREFRAYTAIIIRHLLRREDMGDDRDGGTRNGLPISAMPLLAAESHDCSEDISVG